jgi:hypothetical protein
MSKIKKNWKIISVIILIVAGAVTLVTIFRKKIDSILTNRLIA